MRKSYTKIYQRNEKVIPIFYASDENYLPYLSISLDSVKTNRNKKYKYNIHILHTGIQDSKKEVILNMQEENFNIFFVDVNEKLKEVNNDLQIRDYYTGATYYRIFIANLFKEYQKAIYLDSDTIILGDISKLYDVNLNNNLVGAVTDGVVSAHPIFQDYCIKGLGILPNNYFNAGVLLMNLRQFRKECFYEKFISLLKEYKFVVAQDQDYLNVLCKDKVKYLPLSWNTMPIGGEGKIKPNLIHYNLTLKPWHYNEIPYSKYFFEYAAKSFYYQDVLNELHNYSDAKKQKDQQMEKHLIDLAIREINREDNYIKTREDNSCLSLDSFVKRKV